MQNLVCATNVYASVMGILSKSLRDTAADIDGLTKEISEKIALAKWEADWRVNKLKNGLDELSKLANAAKRQRTDDPKQ